FWPAAELAGSRTVRVAEPRMHGTLAGSPRSLGDEEKVQVVPFFTAVLSRTVPPDEGSDFVLARKDRMTGWLWTVAETPGRAPVAALAGAPVAVPAAALAGGPVAG